MGFEGRLILERLSTDYCEPWKKHNKKRPSLHNEQIHTLSTSQKNCMWFIFMVSIRQAFLKQEWTKPDGKWKQIAPTGLLFASENLNKTRLTLKENNAENGYRRVFLISRRDTSTGENEISEESIEGWTLQSWHTIEQTSPGCWNENRQIWVLLLGEIGGERSGDTEIRVTHQSQQILRGQ